MATAATETNDTATADAAKAAAAAPAKDAADTAAADQAAADKAASDKTAAEKTAADLAAGKKPEGGEATKDGDTPAGDGAPEKYALTLPEHGAVDASDVALVEKIARELNLPNQDAQAMLDRHNATLIDQSEAFATQLKADRDYGGDKLAQTQQLAKQVIDRVRPEGHPRRAAFQRLLDKSGAGNHIEIASFLADLGKMMAEDKPVSGAQGGDADRTKTPLAKRMYPNMQ